MTDKLAAVISRVTQLLLIALDRGSSDGERTNAIRAVQRHLEGVDSDSHELIERIRTPPLDETEMQRIFNAGVERGRAEESEQRRRSAAAVAVAAPFATGVGDGINGYSWRELVGHCVLNKDRIHSRRDIDFITSIAEQLGSGSYYSTPTLKQAPIVRRIFLRWFNGKI